MISSTEKNRLDWSLLLLRIIGGGFMLYGHGLPKLKLWLAGGMDKFPDPLGIGSYASLSLAVFAEFLCASMVLIGAKTRWVVLPLIITMLVAAFVVHFGDTFKKTEPSLIYLCTYIVIFMMGAGRFSIDNQKWSR